MSEEEKRAFDKLTELSSALMGQGEYEVYTFRKEALSAPGSTHAPTPSVVEDERRSRHVRGHGRRGGGAGTGGEESKDDRAPKRDEAPTKSTALDFSAMSSRRSRRTSSSRTEAPSTVTSPRRAN